MIDDSKLIFFTGAPGSKWSAVSYILAHSPKIKINISDRTDDRSYTHPEKFNGVRHVGSYFGPGFEFGHDFDDLTHTTKEDFLAEINKPWAQEEPDSYRIIRCHQFVHSLDWLTENFPTSKIIVVSRHLNGCIDGWFGAGGFDISYPDYHEYYKDKETMLEKMDVEIRLANKWIYKNNLDVHVAHYNHWKSVWGIDDVEANSELDRYMRSLNSYTPTSNDPLQNIKFDVNLAYWNFEDIL